ncbi:MAG: MopE-related protein [Pseudomonadota bacterium]|nr:MopE-related protein [Pseudomonadota bacterium]
MTRALLALLVLAGCTPVTVPADDSAIETGSDDTGDTVPDTDPNDDADSDGYSTDDCNDGDPAVHPGAAEVWYDGVDQDCDGASDLDQDGDGVDDAAHNGTDCDDTDATVFPGAADAWYDGVDQDCAGNDDQDQDGDGFAMGDDCDDLDAAISPAAAEACDGVDQDCDEVVDNGVTTTFYADTDGDGFGDATAGTDACEAPAGSVADASDCDDVTATTYPGAAEICDGLDQDCDTVADNGLETYAWYLDADADGYGDSTAEVVNCAEPAGYTSSPDDCDDADATANPGATEVDADGVDNDCDGIQDPMLAEDRSDWSVYGTSSDDAVGSGGVLALEDIDGDGNGELIVCAPGRSYNSSYPESGAIAFHDVDSLDDPANFIDGYLRLYGSATNDAFGSAMVDLGDPDGDGVHELAVAAYLNDNDADDVGRVYVFDVDGESGNAFGSTLATGGIYADTESGNLGYSVATGDFNGDGNPDLAVGAPGEEDTRGRIYVAFYDDDYTTDDIYEEDASFYARGPASTDHLGHASAIGDVTGDGYDDLISCSPDDDDGGTDAGTCWIVAGASTRGSGATAGTTISGLDTAVITGPSDNSQLGSTPGSLVLGDLDADGIVDLAVGLPGYDGGLGAVLVYAGGTLSGSETSTTATWFLTGDGALGTALSIGDVTGDGTNDLLAGAPTAGSSAEGVVYLFEGGMAAGTWILPDDQYGSWTGAATGDLFGTTLSSLYDLDADGTLDFAAAATGNDEAATDGGKVYVIPAY